MNKQADFDFAVKLVEEPSIENVNKLNTLSEDERLNVFSLLPLVGGIDIYHNILEYDIKCLDGHTSIINKGFKLNSLWWVRENFKSIDDRIETLSASEIEPAILRELSRLILECVRFLIDGKIFLAYESLARIFVCASKLKYGIKSDPVSLLTEKLLSCTDYIVIVRQNIIKRSFKLRKLPYAIYLKSPEWQFIRERKLAQANYQCEKCGHKDHLQVHHKTYEHIGHEWDSDLLVLCDSCHAKEHGKLPKWSSLQ